ncbi:MAG: OB-fold domain-containing protein [Dehalococcoidia bacterium]|nr:OB-fold domain-containing protein [Dehalococcoidia bacterium]
MAQEPSQEYIHVAYTMSRPYRWSAGKYLSKLYREMRDSKKLVTNRCPKCKELLWPPQLVCGRCKVRAGDDWVELSDKGTVAGYTYLVYPLWDPHAGKRVGEDHPYATILLDDGMYVVSRLEEQDKEKLKVGMRVQAVWKEEGRGRGLDDDILYFRTIEQ